MLTNDVVSFEQLGPEIKHIVTDKLSTFAVHLGILKLLIMSAQTINTSIMPIQ